MKPTNMLMYKLTPKSAWQRDVYLCESAARKDANRLYSQGYYQIELYSRSRGGWTLVKAVKQNEREAAAKHAAYVSQLAEAAGATIAHN